MLPDRRWRMRPGQTWQRLRRGFSGSYEDGGPVTLVKKVPSSSGKRWLVLDLTSGATREERFTARDMWRQVV